MKNLPPRSLAVWFAIAAGSMAVAILLGEAYLSKMDLPPGYIWGWHYKEKANQINELGFRGQSIAYGDNDYVVVLVGDSQVESARGSFKEMPEKKLQAHLAGLMNKSVKVFSVGTAGYGQDQELAGLKAYFQKYRANMVVVWETPSNDICNNTFPTHWPENGTPKPTYWLDANGALQGPRDREYPLRTLAVLLGVFGKSQLDNLWEEKYLPPPYQLPTQHTGSYLIDEMILPKEGTGLLHDKTHAGMMLVPPSERMKYGIRLTNLLLKEMQALSLKNGATLVTFTDRREDFPLPDGVYKVSIEGWGDFYPHLSRQQYWENVQFVNDGLDFLIVNVTVPDFKYADDPHLNAVAVDQVMRDLAMHLKQRVAH